MIDFVVRGGTSDYQWNDAIAEIVKNFRASPPDLPPGLVEDGVLPQEAAPTRREIRFQPKEQIFLVSSYYAGMSKSLSQQSLETLSWEVYSKTGATLHRLTERVKGLQTAILTPGAPAPQRDVHLLITGAGFEIESKLPESTLFLGIPSTQEILRRCFEFCQAALREEEAFEISPRAENEFPVLRPTNERHRSFFAQCWDPAKNENLDDLWDYTIQSTLDLTKAKGIEDSIAKTNSKRVDIEAKLRQAFREAFLGFDWGHLPQHIDAAELPWDAWWTTNYTHFADRAIALVKGAPTNGREKRRSDSTDGPSREPGEVTDSEARSSDGIEKDSVNQDLGSWKILSITQEAEQEFRRMFFAEPPSDGRSSAPSSPTRRERYLFKLHGDLAHVGTMAIAGSDKALISSFTQIPVSLHWMYEAAHRLTKERILQLSREVQRSAEDRQNDASTAGSADTVRVFWHIVGHGLKDSVLLRAISGVIRETKVENTSGGKVEHYLLLVNRRAEKIRKELENDKIKGGKALLSLFNEREGKGGRNEKARRVYQVNTTATEWLAMLREHYELASQKTFWKPTDDPERVWEPLRQFTTGEP